MLPDSATPGLRCENQLHIFGRSYVARADFTPAVAGIRRRHILFELAGGVRMLNERVAENQGGSELPRESRGRPRSSITVTLHQRFTQSVNGNISRPHMQPIGDGTRKQVVQHKCYRLVRYSDDVSSWP